MAKKLFVIIFLAYTAGFCLLSYAEGEEPAGTDNTSENSTEKNLKPEEEPQQAESAQRTAQPANPPSPRSQQGGNSPPPDSTGTKDENQEEDKPAPERLPFSASFKNGEFGVLSFTGTVEITNDEGEQRKLDLIKGKWESSIFADQNTKLKKFMLVPITVFAALAFAGLALGIFNFIFGVKKKKLAGLDANVRNIEKDITERCNRLREDLEATRRGHGGHSASPADVHDIKNRLDALEQNLRYFASIRDVDTLSRRVAVLEDDKKIRDDIKRGVLDPLEVFNSWAVNPELALPEAFYYLQEDFRIRETHTLKESAHPSAWISNRDGSAKYLLPNPNFFHPLTNISELYEMDRTRLKSKGRNRIQIIKPCEMADNGYVNYPGELQLL